MSILTLNLLFDYYTLEISLFRSLFDFKTFSDIIIIKQLILLTKYDTKKFNKNVNWVLICDLTKS